MPPRTTLSPWTRFELHVRPTHLEHLLRPLGWDTLDVDDLRERIHTTQALSAHHQLPIGLHAPGPYELVTFPNPEQFDLVLTIHRQPRETWTLDRAVALCPILYGMPCQPGAARSLKREYTTHLRLAQALSRPVAARCHGLCDLLIWPDGHWLVFGRHSLSSPRFLP